MTSSKGDADEEKIPIAESEAAVEADRKERRLPDALVIGVKKSGTITLATFLAQHPQLVTTEEVKFFTDETYKEVSFNFTSNKDCCAERCWLLPQPDAAGPAGPDCSLQLPRHLLPGERDGGDGSPPPHPAWRPRHPHIQEPHRQSSDIVL